MNPTIKYALENISAPNLHLENLGLTTFTDEEIKALWVVVCLRFENNWATTYTSPFGALDLMNKLAPKDAPEQSKSYAAAIVGRLIEMDIISSEPVKTVSKRREPERASTPPPLPEPPRKKRPGNAHPVEQFELKTGAKLGTFPSVLAAQKATGITDSCIAKCCAGSYVHAGGYKWRYVQEEQP